MSEESTVGLDRRQLLRRGAVLGGALVWTTPVIQSLSPSAYAVGTPSPCGDISWVGVVVRTGTAGNYEYRVYKLEGAKGYTPQVVTDAGGDSTNAFDRMLESVMVNERLTSLTLQTSSLSPLPFSSSVGAGGDLVFTVNVGSNDATMVGWMIHDGQVEGAGKNNLDGTVSGSQACQSTGSSKPKDCENAFAFTDDYALVPSGWNIPGEAGPSTGTGTFTWSKPGYEVAQDCG